MTARRPLALVLLLALLTFVAVPAASFAQSAGDDQYEDPLPPGGGGGSDPAPSPPPSGDGGSTQTPAPSAGAAQAPSADTPSQGNAGSSRNVPLARTGFDALIPAIAGLLLLAGGAAMLLGPRRRALRR